MLQEHHLNIRGYVAVGKNIYVQPMNASKLTAIHRNSD